MCLGKSNNLVIKGQKRRNFARVDLFSTLCFSFSSCCRCLNFSNSYLPLCTFIGIFLLINMFRLCLTMELLKITIFCRLFFHLEDIVDFYSYNIRSAIEIIQEWFQVKEVFMEHLNNFNIISVIQNFIALLKIKDLLIPLQHHKAVKWSVTVILCGTLDIEIQSGCLK